MKDNIIQFPQRQCAHCGEPILTSDEVHPACAEGYERYWQEREAEMQYRASLENGHKPVTLKVVK